MLGSIFLNNFSIFCLSITAKVPPDEEKEVSFRPPADDVDRVDPTEDADTGGGDKLDDSNRQSLFNRQFPIQRQDFQPIPYVIELCGTDLK